jgi:predicted nucleic acid-binding protein
MNIHLDTSFLINGLVPRSPEGVMLRGWIREGASLGISCIGWAEFLCGPLDARAIELASRVVPTMVPFIVEDAVLSASLFNQSGRRRGSLTDCMIAATAVRADASLATSNPTDFRRFETVGLGILTA